MDTSENMDRLGALDPQHLSGAARQLYDDMTEYFDGWPFIYKLPENGQMVGPFGIELHTPGPAYGWLDMTKSLATYKSLPALPREIAILVIGSYEQAEYEMYAHSAVSGLSKMDLDSILVDKKCPPSLDRQCQVAFNVATHLASIPGPLDESVWMEAVEVLGREAAIVLMHYCGLYKYVCTILNAFDAKLPAPKQW